MVSNLKKQVQTFENKLAAHCKKSSPTALGLLPRLGSSNKKKMTNFKIIQSKKSHQNM
jgi:hypothetical protein